MVETGWPEPAALREALRRADGDLRGIAPVLVHLLSARDMSLLSDAVVARIRGMVLDVSRQLLTVEAEATGHKARASYAASRAGALADRLFNAPALIAHCHALAMEWQIGQSIERRLGVEPALSPLVQDLVGHEDATVAQSAMAALAAQTRFLQTQQRMELPIGELPAEVFHEVLTVWREAGQASSADALTRAETRLRSEYEEGGSRLARLERLVTIMGGRPAPLLAILHAGTPVFLTALSALSGQPRDRLALSTTGDQLPRLALALRAAGNKPEDIEAQLLAIDPDATRLPDLDQLGTREAAAWLAQGGVGE